MDDDSFFTVGGLRCKSQADWLVRIGVGQLPKALQNSVRIRVDEDREQAVRRFVHDKNHTDGVARGDRAVPTRSMRSLSQNSRTASSSSSS